MRTFTAVLDANVLYGSFVRDVLLELAKARFFAPRWSQEILDELEGALVRSYSNAEQKHRRKIQVMAEAFPSAIVDNHLHLANDLHDTDPKDRHVLAAAIRVQAGALVTFNRRDFPEDMLERFGIELQHPDDFLLNLIDLDVHTAMAVISTLIASYSRPAMSALSYAAAINNSQCPKFAAFIAANEEEIEDRLNDLHIERIALERRHDGTPRIRVKLEDLL